MIRTIISHITNSLLSRLPNVSYFNPLIVAPNTQAGHFDLKELLDGYLLACPKRRNSYRVITRKRYGNDNWKDGTKLWKSKRSITTCMECGSFHEFHTICKNCFKKVHEASKKIMHEIEERERPLWFAPNLTQVTANPAKEISGPSVESTPTIKLKVDTN